ncbi:hypothetical protein ACWEP4_27260 [Streptomyces sp. NPDC004227]
MIEGLSWGSARPRRDGKSAAATAIGRAREHDGIRLPEGRVESSDPGHTHRGFADRWRLTADTDADRLRSHLLAAVAQGAGRFAELLQPGRYVDELSALPDKRLGHWEALAVLLAGRGPSSEPHTACAGLRAPSADRPLAARSIDALIKRALANSR